MDGILLVSSKYAKRHLVVKNSPGSIGANQKKRNILNESLNVNYFKRNYWTIMINDKF